MSAFFQIASKEALISVASFCSDNLHNTSSSILLDRLTSGSKIVSRESSRFPWFCLGVRSKQSCAVSSAVSSAVTSSQLSRSTNIYKHVSIIYMTSSSETSPFLSRQSVSSTLVRLMENLPYLKSVQSSPTQWVSFEHFRHGGSLSLSLWQA